MNDLICSALQQLLVDLGYQIVSCEGWEADDILGTLSAQCEREGAQCVIATGDRPDSSLYEALKGKVPELYNVGDSNGAGVIAKAVNQGYYCALKL